MLGHVTYSVSTRLCDSNCCIQSKSSERLETKFGKHQTITLIRVSVLAFSCHITLYSLS
jgi:hypothetical protein